MSEATETLAQEIRRMGWIMGHATKLSDAGREWLIDKLIGDVRHMETANYLIMRRAR